MNKRNIDVIYEEAMHCGMVSLVFLPVMAGVWFWQRKKGTLAVMVLVEMALQLKMISKIFVNYRPDRKCPVCEAVIPEDSNYCPICGYIIHKDLWGVEDMVEFTEDEEWDCDPCDIDRDYRRIEEEIINGIA